MAAAAATSTADDQTTDIPLPLRAAGRAQPLVKSTTYSLTPFSPPVLSHLNRAYRSLQPTGQSQNGPHFPTESSFLSYMATPDSSAMSAWVSEDLTYPIPSYYISSSHNTYLSGHQLYGEASGDAYTNVLNRGCRCLEIDVWDGDSSDSETSDSDQDGHHGNESRSGGRERSGSKASRWTRVRAKASRMRSRSRSQSGALHSHGHAPAEPRDDASVPEHPQPPTTRPRKSTSEGSALNPAYLSPQQSPSLPIKPEPRVYHGYTLTQPVTFRSVCHAIRASAFVSTDLPLIVSLEVHASLSQQEVMVQIMKDIWAGLLVDIGCDSDIPTLPSPDKLRSKILIKVKWTPNSQTGESNNPLEQITSNSTEGTVEDDGVISASEKKAKKVLAALSELGIYTRAYTFKSFSQPEAAFPTHVFSLSENKMHTIHPDPANGPALFKHNKNFLMRVFPKGTRISSSNVDPTFHWRQGAQMVALNWQKLDKGMMLNQGMFAGTHGWVLKPDGYRTERPDQVLIDKSPGGPAKRTLDLTIILLAAQNLPLPADKDAAYGSKIKPYVKFQLHVDTHGPPGQGGARYDGNTSGGDDLDAINFKRRSASYRTQHPDFAGEAISWLKVPDLMDELSFLRYVCFVSLALNRLSDLLMNGTPRTHASVRVTGFSYDRFVLTAWGAQSIPSYQTERDWACSDCHS